MLFYYFLLIGLGHAIFVSFSTSYTSDNFVATRCTGYIGQQFCGGYVAGGAPSAGYIHYESFSPNASTYYHAAGIAETVSQRGLISSFSNPTYFVSTNKIGGVYIANISNTSITRILTHNYSSYFDFLIA